MWVIWLEEILNKLEADGLRLIELHFSDLHGNIKSVTIPAKRATEALTKGIWFDGSSIEGFTRICESDMFLKPDRDTYAVLPWTNGEKARFICDVYTHQGKPFEGDPRGILKKMVEKGKSLGYEYMAGPEIEFFLFKSNGNGELVPHDSGGYFDFSPMDLASEIRKEIIYDLEKFGIEVEAGHHEVGKGQHEIDFRYGKAVETADRTLTLKYVIKSVALKYGLIANCMPKPIYKHAGSGMHVHQSFNDIKTGENLFYDEKDPYNLSGLAKHFVAGQLKHAKALSAVVSPTVNSYKRLVAGYEAPVYISWACTNRSALIRIPKILPGAKKAARCELRCPDPSANPYLAFSVMLAAGLDGIENKLTLPKPVEENIYHLEEATLAERNIERLPSSLIEAINELKKDKLILDSLGKHTSEMYLKAKEEEWLEYSMQITDWELKKYMNR